MFPLILIAFGNPEIGVMFAGYLGLAFLAISFVSIGLFTSSLTQNQIIAAISCFGSGRVDHPSRIEPGHLSPGAREGREEKAR